MPVQLVVFDGTACHVPPPDLVASAKYLRGRGIKIGTTADAGRGAAGPDGFAVDAAVCAADVPEGRPAPWMLFRVFERLNVYPATAAVLFGGSRAAVREAKNAGAWAVGVTDGSDEMGLTAGEFAALSEAEREARRAAVRDAFLDAGADAVIDTLAELPEAIDAIHAMMG